MPNSKAYDSTRGKKTETPTPTPKPYGAHYCRVIYKGNKYALLPLAMAPSFTQPALMLSRNLNTALTYLPSDKRSRASMLLGLEVV